MKTLLLHADQPADLKQAGQLLTAGKLVAVPTETVYGLAADASNPEAVAAIFAAKGRPRNHPLIVHLGDIAQLADWAHRIPDWVAPLVSHFWPGPLTLLLEKHPQVSDVVTGGLNTIGLRMPDHPALLSILRRHRLAVAAPSANPYQKLSPTSADQVMAGLGGKIAAVLDGGPCQVGTESTILQVTASGAQILRAGPLSAADLQPYVPVPVSAPSSHAVAVSGNKKIHYQPDAPLSLKTTAELQQQLPDAGADIGCLLYSATLQDTGQSQVLRLPADHRGYRKGLYHALYELDQAGVCQIWVESPPQDATWQDIQDRLSRAAALPE